MSEGSTWDIWDFHLHTPFSVLNNQFGDPNREETWEMYINRLEEAAAEKRIVAVGITDYFTIEGYKKLRSYQQQGRLANILIFPNIELRVDKIIYRSRDVSQPKRLNLHVLFSPDVLPEDIEEQFLHDLDFVSQNDPFDRGQKKKLKPRNLEDFGRSLQQQHPPFLDEAPMIIGCKNAIVSVDQVKERLLNGFKGNHLIVLANEDLSLMSWDGQDHATRKHLLQMSHALFSANKRDRDFCLGKAHTSFEAFIDEFKSPKPCIWGCDSHGFEERFLEPDNQCFCWIKADITWEGLKSVIFEPEARVKIQPSNPEPSKSIYTVAQICVSETQINPELKIEPINLVLNPNLVAIIGGRGSGKTALLDLIASCFRQGSKLGQMESSFYGRLYGIVAKKQKANNQPVDVNLVFRSGENFQKNVGRDSSYFEKTDVIYLTQNHFEEYSSNPSRLNNHIKELIFEKYAEEKRQYDALESEVTDIIKQIQGINLDIQQLSQDVRAKGQLKTNLAQKSGEKQDFQSRLELTVAGQEEQQNKIQQLTQTNSELRQKKRKNDSLPDELETLQETIHNFEKSYSEQVSAINSTLSYLFGSDLTELLPERFDFIHIDEGIRLIQAKLPSLSELISEEIQRTSAQLQELEGLNRTIADLNEKIEETDREIEDIKEKINEVEQKENRFRQLDKQRFILWSSALQKIMEVKHFLLEVIKQFEVDKDEILTDLQFEPVVSLQTENLIEQLGEKLDNRSMPIASLKQMIDPLFEQLLNLLNMPEPTDAREKLNGMVEQYQVKVSDLGERRKAATTLSDLYNTILGRYFEIEVKISFNNKSLEKLSMGERAVVLLKVHLAFDDKPLIIDQPEEDLDNRYIYDGLTPVFRNAKTKRQIIIATHNANLVVNTDAEQVIIADYTDGVLSYKAGSLEDSIIRGQIKKILEGGEEAFKKREAKYGLVF